MSMIYAGKPEADVVVIGSGLGGLCCAGLLARYGKDVIVLESHDQPGGAAHSFEIKDYKFDSGPSLFSGFQSRGLQANPLAQVFIISFILFIPFSKTTKHAQIFFMQQMILLMIHDMICICSNVCFFLKLLMVLQVLDALGESIPCVKYDSWMVYVPEGEFLSRIGPTEFFKVN